MVKAGFARTNIDPCIGQDNIGDYARLKPGIGIGNELFAKSMVLDDGQNRAALVTADVIGFPGTLVEDIRLRAGRLTGIDEKNIMLSASHTHSSPATTKNDKASHEYLTELAKKIAGIIYLADCKKEEVRIGVGKGEVKVAINRWQNSGSTVKWGPNPDAPVDYELPVIRFDSLKGDPLAVLLNYASHPSIMGKDNLLYSGDYVSFAQEFVEKVYDRNVMAMFSTGAGGDIKIAVLSGDRKSFRYGNLEDCRRYGTIVGAEAVKVIETIKTRPAAKISTSTMNVDLPLVKLPSIEDVEREKKRIEDEISRLKGTQKEAMLIDLNWALETIKKLKEGTAPESIKAEVNLLRIGDEIALFAVPGELFVEVGINIKKAIGLAGSFVLAYTNGYLGYLPSKQAEKDGWCKHDDSYMRTQKPANFSGKIEDVLVNAAGQMCR
ncbi:MAG: hypothetical protein GXP33_04685 [Spirochaetes bacterium]|nr:hypothetical protein [Spirochaetota bacterium]